MKNTFKNFLFIGGGLLLVAGIISSCEKDEATATTVINPAEAIVPTAKFISAEEATELQNNYLKTTNMVSTARIGKQDATSAWWSLEDLKGYIAYVEQQGAEQSIAVDGIRFYFGVYPAIAPEGKQNMSTLFMCPTTDITTSTNKTSSKKSIDVRSISAMNRSTGSDDPKRRIYAK